MNDFSLHKSRGGRSFGRFNQPPLETPTCSCWFDQPSFGQFDQRESRQVSGSSSRCCNADTDSALLSLVRSGSGGSNEFRNHFEPACPIIDTQRPSLTGKRLTMAGDN